MTPDQLKQIRERCERVTSGPWYNDKGRVTQRGTQTRLAGVVADIIDRQHPTAILDADFIAHARTDIPLLLDEIERLRRAIEKHEREFFDDQIVYQHDEDLWKAIK